MIQFRNQIIKENLFESYRNGTLHLPQEIGSMIWNVQKLFNILIRVKDFNLF